MKANHPESGHYDDQAEKLFSQGRAKSTYFRDRKELEKHVRARETLTF